jgi:glycerate dehydrogenase
VYNGDWEKNPDWCFWDYPLIELAGKIYGLMGCGNIGIHTAEIAKALGMRVIAFDARETDEALKLGVEYVSLEELFARSDVLGLQMPLFPFNTGIINKENIAKMKDGVIIINNSRGQMVDEQDLADALISGKVAAAALDVVSTEPIKGDNPLLKAPNCIITPHISWAAKESRQRIMDCSVLNLESFLKGTPVNVVNP